ncbi:Tetratricopeptide repeat protein 1 [Linum perenne]
MSLRNMAVIEEVPLEDKKQETTQNSTPEKPKSSSESTTNSGDTIAPASTASGSANVRENDSDGFETASERDISDNDEDNQEGQQHCDSVVNDEEAKQEKALALANDAKLEGNRLFGDMKFEEALVQYDIALQVAAELPSSSDLRSICHSNRAVCFLKLGKYEETVQECTKALEINPSYVKALRRRGEAHEKLEHFEEAIADMKKILELDPSNDFARPSIIRLEPLAAEKREKMKEEMIGKLDEQFLHVLEAEGDGELFVRAIWDECGQLQSCQGSKYRILLYFVPELVGLEPSQAR